MKVFLHIFHTLIWLLVIVAIAVALTDVAYSQQNAKPEAKLVYIDEGLFAEAVDRLIERGRNANHTLYSIPSGFIECGISIYFENGEIKLSEAFTGKGKSRVIRRNLSSKHPKSMKPCQFTDALPEGAELLAVLHTHPTFPHSLIPSANDMMFSNQFDVPIFTVDQTGKRYQYYYSFQKQSPSIGFLKENGLWRDSRKATTQAYWKYLRIYGKEFVSEEFRLRKPNQAKSETSENHAVIAVKHPFKS